MRLLPLLFMLPSATTGAAQVVRVRVHEEGTPRPAVGALVSLREPEQPAAVQVLTDEAGAAALTAPRPGRYLVRVDRIGYRGVTVGPLSLGPADTLAVAVAVPTDRLSLPDLAVLSRAPVECRLDPEAGGLVSTLWTEARKALVATELTTAEPPLLDVTRYQRVYLPGGSVLDESSSRERTRSASPFVAADPVLLARSGFHRRVGGRHVFFAPDARVLLSPDFLRQHCFAPARSSGDSLLVGLAFEPTTRYRGRTDVTGVLWLDRGTAELRRIDFSHTNVDRDIRSGAEGGRIEFVRLQSGGWIVGRWRVRVGYFEEGGQLAIVGADGSASPAGTRVVGVVYDSLAGQPLAGALVSTRRFAADPTGIRANTDTAGRYRIDLAAGGDLVLSVDHPLIRALDPASGRRSLTAVEGQELRADFVIPAFATVVERRCPRRRTSPATEGLIVGRLQDTTGQGRQGEVEAAWTAGPALRPGYRVTVAGGEVRVVVGSDPDGRFTVCGVPAGVGVRIVPRGLERDSARRVTVAAARVAVTDFTVP